MRALAIGDASNRKFDGETLVEDITGGKFYRVLMKFIITLCGQPGAAPERQRELVMPMAQELVSAHARADGARFGVAQAIESTYHAVIGGAYQGGAAAGGRHVRVWLATAEREGDRYGESQNDGEGLAAAGYAMAELYEEDIISLSPRCVYVHDIYVAEFARRSGLARQLTDVCCDWGRAVGAESARLTTMSANTAAQKCFGQAGFTPCTTEMIRQLK